MLHFNFFGFLFCREEITILVLKFRTENSPKMLIYVDELRDKTQDLCNMQTLKMWNGKNGKEYS